MVDIYIYIYKFYDVRIVTVSTAGWSIEKVKHICYFYKLFHFSERFYRLFEEI